MKQKYDKEQIAETIRYWESVLEGMNESNPYTPGRVNRWVAHGMSPAYEPSLVARRERQQLDAELRQIESDANNRFDIAGYMISVRPDRYGRDRHAELVFVSPTAREIRALSNVEETIPEARDVVNWIRNAKRYTVKPDQVYIKRA